MTTLLLLFLIYQPNKALASAVTLSNLQSAQAQVLFQKEDLSIQSDTLTQTLYSTALFSNETTNDEFVLDQNLLDQRATEFADFGLKKYSLLQTISLNKNKIYLTQAEWQNQLSFDLETQIKLGSQKVSLIWSYKDLKMAQTDIPKMIDAIKKILSHREPSSASIDCQVSLFDSQIKNTFANINSILKASCQQKTNSTAIDIFKGCTKGIANSPLQLVEFLYQLSSFIFQMNMNTSYRQRMQGMVQQLIIQAWKNPTGFISGLWQSISKMLTHELEQVKTCGPEYQARVVCQVLTDFLTGGFLLKKIKESKALVHSKPTTLHDVTENAVKSEAQSKLIKTEALEEEIKLLRKENPQMAIWKLHEQGHIEKARELESKITDTLKNGEFAEDPTHIGVGSQGAKHVKFKDGTEGVLKLEEHTGPGSQTQHEVAAYEIDQKLGLNIVPITTLRGSGDKMGSIQLFIKNADKVSMPDRPDHFSFLDTLISNFDRESTNYLTVQGRAIAIDNGRAFRAPRVTNFNQNLGDTTHLLRFETSPVKREILINNLKTYLPPKTVIQKLESTTESEWKELLSPRLTSDELSTFLNKRKRILDDTKALEEKFGDRIYPDGQFSPLMHKKYQDGLEKVRLQN